MVRTIQSPLDALRADLASPSAERAIAGAGASWLPMATVLHRLLQLPPDARVPYARRTIAAWRSDETRSASPSGPVVTAWAECWDAADAGGGAEATARLVDALASHAEEMERAGALHLAFAMLGVMRALFAPSAGARADALVLVQQARVARQLGDVATAAELYDLADGVGRQHRIPEARGRAAVGRGILANMRGNYPEARADFRRALAIGDGLPGVTLLAHHGLMVAALAARDADTALVHGWQAFAGTLGDADRRADLLVNLGEIARTAGSPDAAASCHAAALRLTRLERLRMAALGGSVQAAADLHDVARLARLAREAVAAVRDAAQPYDRAMLLLELAEAHARVALDAPARRHADAARTIAAEQPFHEVTHRLDAVHAILAARAGVDARVPVAGVAPARLTAAARTVLARLRQLPDDADALLSLVA